MHWPEPILCVVQARMGSTRLPGKVLADLCGQPLLAYLLQRLAPLPTVATVVATSDLDRDDEVAALATSVGTPVVRGSEADVLDRFLRALDAHPDATHVVRITADCPLTDPHIVDQVVQRHLERDADYTSNVLPRTFPKGLDVEIARATALRTAGVEARANVEREHVMPFLYRHPERFSLANVTSGRDLGHLRWTVDTPDDLEVVRGLAAALADKRGFSWLDALDVFDDEWPPRDGGIRLRPADAGDRDRLLEWRNDPDAVRFSLSRRPVEPAEHERWFAARLEDPATRLLIGEVDGEPVGMVRLDVENAEGVVSVAVAPTHRGRGLGTRLLVALLDDLRGDPQVDRVRAEVLEDNEASRRAFLAAGFTDDGVQDGVRQFRWENDDT